MPRQNRPRREPPRPLSGTLGNQRTESYAGSDWVVIDVTANQATKTYRCPGCDHEVRPGTPHVVVWPADDMGGVDDRRHWHAPCWRARDRRGPTKRRW